ncbi:MAG: right-handed parallel beta-helix repeat-containing protein [Phycisphaeraceae bacterium]|nr:right-handed parallel beta-helix repeat-containing protein [Phycisphaeraceae bacterium]
MAHQRRRERRWPNVLDCPPGGRRACRGIPGCAWLVESRIHRDGRRVHGVIETMADFVITDYGAAGDGQSYDTGAVQRAIDAAHQAGGGRVVVPGGRVYLSATFRLRSFVELHLEPGSRIIGGPEKADYPNASLRCLVEAVDCDCIAITGMGEIDGQAHLHMVEDLKYIYRGNEWRPRLMGLIRCRRVTIRDVTLRNSANWGLHMTGCEDVVIHGIRILNDLKVPNCDGIDPDHCRNVRISDCHIECGDDCIVLKNTKEFGGYFSEPDCGPTENITVTGCTLISTSAAIKIGTESVSDFRDIVFDGCVIRSSSRGLAIQLRDQGNIENVIFSNMIVETRLFEKHWWGRAEPIYVTALRRFGQADREQLPDWNRDNRLGRVRHVRFSNVLCRGENGVFIAGSEDSPIEDLILDNVRVEIDKSSKWPGGMYDRRPCDALGPAFRDPEQDPGLFQHPTCGVYCDHAQDVRLRGVEVVWGKNRPDYFSSALKARHTRGLVLDGFRGKAAHQGVPDEDVA